MITENQIVTAETAAADAEKVRTAAQDALVQSPYSTVAAVALTEALQDEARKAANARDLRAAFVAQKAAERAAADRGTLEKQAAPLIAAAGKELESTRKALAKRAEEAQHVLADLMDSAVAYSTAVAAHSAALAAAGLDLAAGSETGAGSTLTGPVVLVKGRRYRQADPGGVAVWMAHRVGESRLSSTHPMVAALRFLPGRGAVQEQAEALFAGLPQPEKVEHPPVKWPPLDDLSKYTKLAS